MTKTRILVFVAAGLVLALSVSLLVRNHLAAERCARFDLIWQPGQGCVPDPSKIILKRDLQRS